MVQKRLRHHCESSQGVPFVIAKDPSFRDGLKQSPEGLLQATENGVGLRNDGWVRPFRLEKASVALADEDRDGIRTQIRHHEIDPAISVDVGGHQAAR